jgi:hypothetical protein
MPGTFLPSFTKFDLSSNLTKENLGLKEDSFVFVNFNTHHKITPFIFNVWMRILKKIKNSILYLSEGNEYSRENLKKEAANRGIAVERIIFSKNLINNRMQRDFLEKKKDKNVLKFKNFLLKKNIFYPKNGIIFFSNTIEKYQLSYLIKNINFGLKKFFKKNNSRELIT